MYIYIKDIKCTYIILALINRSWLARSYDTWCAPSNYIRLSQFMFAGNGREKKIIFFGKLFLKSTVNYVGISLVISRFNGLFFVVASFQ